VVTVQPSITVGAAEAADRGGGRDDATPDGAGPDGAGAVAAAGGGTGPATAPAGRSGERGVPVRRTGSSATDASAMLARVAAHHPRTGRTARDDATR
jgi:hypothetical protein